MDDSVDEVGDLQVVIARKAFVYLRQGWIGLDADRMHLPITLFPRHRPDVVDSFGGRETRCGTTRSAYLSSSTTVRLGRDRAYFDADAWRGTWGRRRRPSSDQSGNSLHRPHAVDRRIPDRGGVCPFAALRHAQYVEVEDTAVASIQFANGGPRTIPAGTTFGPGLGNQVLVSGDTGATVTVTEFPEGSPSIRRERKPMSPDVATAVLRVIEAARRSATEAITVPRLLVRPST